MAHRGLRRHPRRRDAEHEHRAGRRRPAERLGGGGDARGGHGHQRHLPPEQRRDGAQHLRGVQGRGGGGRGDRAGLRLHRDHGGPDARPAHRELCAPLAFIAPLCGRASYLPTPKAFPAAHTRVRAAQTRSTTSSRARWGGRSWSQPCRRTPRSRCAREARTSGREGMGEGGGEAEARAAARQNRWQGNGEQTARQCRTGTSFQ